ncbi:MAG: hypothetical protein KZQ81_04495, partial [Candidatus Thiodiazotropha sp. (ex Rostrolucina anterorostrata)]|nr:hypothetical protein [Candidatus Thiodiazotropha sp. (ex Rostrolucina anterorostrata)]
WNSFLSIICLSSPMFGFNDRQLHRIQDSLIGSGTAYAIYPNRRFISQRVRVLADFQHNLFGDQPYWDELLLFP